MADKVATDFLSSVKAKGRQAMNWLRGIINRVRRGSKPPTASRRELMTDRNTGVIRLPSIGRMYLFTYDPKWEKKLPWYDVYPLVIPFDYAKGGFYGINLHYLPPNARTDLLLRLIKAQGGGGNLDADFKLGRLTFNVISRFKPAIPCIKRYLYGQVRSKGFYGISGEDWAYAAALPIQQFEKADASTVWKWSKSQY